MVYIIYLTYRQIKLQFAYAEATILLNLFDKKISDFAQRQQNIYK